MIKVIQGGTFIDKLKRLSEDDLTEYIRQRLFDADEKLARELAKRSMEIWREENEIMYGKGTNVINGIFKATP